MAIIYEREIEESLRAKFENKMNKRTLREESSNLY